MLRKIMAMAAGAAALGGTAHAATNPLAPLGASSHLPPVPPSFGAGLLMGYALLLLLAAFLSEGKGESKHH